MLGRERHVVPGIIRRPAVCTDVRAVKGEVAGVPRPHPVIHVTAVVADVVAGCVDEAHVAYLEALDQLVRGAAVVARDLAANPAYRFALADQRFLGVFDGLVACALYADQTDDTSG